MLRWLVIGVGDITTRRVIPAIQEEPRSSLHAILTRDPAKAAPYPAEVFTDLDAALGDPAIDAVYVASPVALHGPQTIRALRAGRHVLCEKPMALSYREAREMVDAAAAAGKTLGVAYYRRTYPKVSRARQILEQGSLGQPVLAYASSHGWFDGASERRAWLLDPAMAGGGPLYDVASHRLDLMNFLFGEPRRASGHISSVVHHARVEDNATVLVDYTGGIRAIVDVRWHSRVDRDELRIIGTDGEMDLSPLNGPELRHPGGLEQWPTHPNLHVPCVRNFVDSVIDGAPLLSSGSTACWTDWITEQVVSSQPAG